MGTVPSNTMNLGDPQLELIDPTPNIGHLLVTFDNLFFWGKLASRTTVRWSKKMYSCAGLCYNRGHVIDIALSEPLLKLRPRKNLVETFLHEMIHAYLIITRQNDDRDGHGPRFQAHMNRINKCTGLNITIYHDFHEEVNLYQNHWWRCNGPCRTQEPYFGIIHKTSNRTPGPKDYWYEQHRRSCGGTFIKIKEPIHRHLELNNIPIRPVINNDNSEPTLDAIANTEINNKKHKSDDVHVDSPPSKVRKYNDEETLVAVHVENEINVDCPLCHIKVTIGEINRHLDECLDEEMISDLESKDEQESKDEKTLVTFPVKSEINVDCPICKIKVTSGELNRHLDECLNREVISDLENKQLSGLENKQDIINSDIMVYPGTSKGFEITNQTCPCCGGKYNKPIEEHLDECLAFFCNNTILSEEGASTSTTDPATIVIDDENNIFDESSTFNATGTKYPCPCCLQMVEQEKMNEHLDECLS